MIHYTSQNHYIISGSYLPSLNHHLSAAGLITTSGGNFAFDDLESRREVKKAKELPLKTQINVNSDGGINI